VLLGELMSVSAMRFAAVDAAAPVATSDVLALRDRLHVGGVDAGMVPTEMIERQMSGQFSVQALVDIPMSALLAPVSTNHAVAARTAPTNPNPAARIRFGLNEPIEPRIAGQRSVVHPAEYNLLGGPGFLGGHGLAVVEREALLHDRPFLGFRI